MITDPSFDVLAANALATALSPRLAAGANRLRDVFLDPAEQALYPDWERLGIGGAAGQMLVVYHPDPGTNNADKLALLTSAMQTPAAPQGTTANEQARADANRGESVRRSVADEDR
ncbi:hypothetical protein [Nonomuraea sp. NPDC049784]|uniref:MmyB family transcriptional regulator n=1 Tax=Nonomuraea sp. NPDC049784 TaxID=3154361 RepID=UPI0033C125EF